MSDDKGVDAHVTVEKSRVWDLKSTGQVSSGVRNFAAICCICFHPTDPTLCVVTVQGPLSVLSFYNAHSGGKMSTVPLRSVVAAAQFTKYGDEIVVVFRDWNVMKLRPGTPRWSRTLIPFKKEPRPAEQILLALNPDPAPIIYFAQAGQTKLNVVLYVLPSSKGSSLLSSSQKNAFSLKLSNAPILELAGHPEEVDTLFVLFGDGTLQAFLLENATLKKLYYIGEALSPGQGLLCQLEVLPHPFITKSTLILTCSGQELVIYVSNSKSEISVVDKLPLKGIRKVTGVGIYKTSHSLLLAFGESADGKVKCAAARICGSASDGLSLVPISVTMDSGATDVSLSQHSVSGMINVSSNGGGAWMELWDAVPAWAQNPAQIGQSRQKIRNIKIHSVMGAIAAQVVSCGSSGTGPNVLLWTVHDNTHPTGGAHCSLVVPLHSSSSFWSGGGLSEEYKLEFPHHCYFVSGNSLAGCSLRSKEIADIAPFSPPNGRSGPAKAESVAYSKHHRAWLLFFRSFSADVGYMGFEEWTYTLQREDEVGASPPWFKPGISGAFIGRKEEHFCILDSDLFTLYCYATKTVSGNQPPLLTLILPNSGLLTPAIFQGPPISHIPTPPPPAETTPSGNIIEEVYEEQEETKEVDEKVGFGVIIWVNRFRQVAMGSMISQSDNKSRSRYETESIEYVQEGIFSELGDGEIIIQVAWQTIIEDEESYQEPNSYACAILTNQRLMLFLANGYPVLSCPPQNSPGLASPPTSCLWVGPALFYLTQSGEVNQVLWDGSTVMICGAPSTTGSAVLLTALADRVLFLCKEAGSDSWQVATRHAIIGFALLMGWATLASSGLIPSSWANAHARTQMKVIIQYFDLTTVSAPVAKALVQSEFADIARMIANRWTKDAQKIKVACSVAAGQWQEAASSLINEYENSVYHPGLIHKGSALWKRFYSVALGATSSKQTDVAADLFSYAGEWEWALLILAITSSNPSKTNEVLKRAEQYLKEEDKNRVDYLATELRKTRINMSAIGATALDTEQHEFDSSESWIFASAGFVASMSCIQGKSPQGMIKAEDIGPIDPLETQDIKGYVSGASKQPTHGSFLRRSVSASLSGRSLLARSRETSSRLEFAIPEVLEVGGGHEASGALSSPTEAQMKPVTSPTRTTGFSDIQFDETFSSDEESNDLERGGFGKKFKIQIKAKEESHGTTSADALREAAKNLRLGAFNLNPSLGPSGFSNALKGASLTRTESVSSKSSSTSNLEQKSGFSSSEFGSDPFQQRNKGTGDFGHASEAFQRGMRQMEAGNWDGAIEEFSVDGMFGIPRGKQYLAAVLLLKARLGVSETDAARIDRIASALDLEDKHKKALVTQAIKQNMQCGNYGYAKEKISWLLNVSSGSTSSQFTSAVMQQLDECDKHDAKNMDISPFENLNSITEKVESVSNVPDMKIRIDELAS